MKRPAPDGGNVGSKRPRIAYNLEDQLLKCTRLLVQGKGIIEADNSEPQCQYLEFLLNHDLSNYVSGVVLRQQILTQRNAHNQTFASALNNNNIIPGVKLDEGYTNLSGSDEFYTVGLLDLEPKCKKLYDVGARFAKWRASFIIDIQTSKPSQTLIRMQANDIGKYAYICQTNGIVPIVDIDISPNGTYDMELASKVSETIWSSVIKSLNDNNVILESCILKVNTIMPGRNHSSYTSKTPYEISTLTLRSLQRTIPPALGGILLLPYFNKLENATIIFKSIRDSKVRTPWPVTFTLDHNLQSQILEIWKEKSENLQEVKTLFVNAAQTIFHATFG